MLFVFWVKYSFLTGQITFYANVNHSYFVLLLHIINMHTLSLSGDCHTKPGIRYITELLIKKLSKQENLARVTSLNLSLAKDGGKKFKVSIFTHI